VLEVGQQLPEAQVFDARGETVSLREAVAGLRALVVFYLFDFSST
jgi:peroxiredoxin